MAGFGAGPIDGGTLIFAAATGIGIHFEPPGSHGGAARSRLSALMARSNVSPKTHPC
jgi:hypothetical protein